jgi:phosphoglycerate-specific signal transduction histidine kinase
MNLYELNKLINELKKNKDIELVKFYEQKKKQLIKRINEQIKQTLCTD